MEVVFPNMEGVENLAAGSWHVAVAYNNYLLACDDEWREWMGP